MKRILTILAAVLFTVSVFLPQQTSAQSPQKMSYQAIIRDNTNKLVTNKIVGMKISILQGSASGTIVYWETQTPSTDANGLISIEFGGKPGLDAIDWANGPHFIKTETDPDGGTNYTISGVSQLLSVPYALYAQKAESNMGSSSFTYLWPGVFDETHPIPIFCQTNENWKGNRKIMMNGYVFLEFNFPEAAINNNDFSGDGEASIMMFLKYNDQVIMPIAFTGVQLKANHANVTLPMNAIIPNSTAGNSMQFFLEYYENRSRTRDTGPQGEGAYPIDVNVTVYWSWIEF